MRKGGRLSRKYILVLVALVAGTLLASGAISIYSSYEENKQALVALQREKARGAAYSIENFVKEIESQLGWTTQPSQLVAAGAASEQRRVDSIRLLKQLLAITELSYLDAKGLERLRVSRLAMDVIDSRIDYLAGPQVPRGQGRPHVLRPGVLPQGVRAVHDHRHAAERAAA